MQPQTQTNPNVAVIYTTPTCPDCRQLKAWLDREDIAYQERDLADPEIMQEAKTRYGVRVAPVTVIGNWFTYGTFAAQKPKIEAALNRFEETQT
ncbi:glutaredoxin family protein [Mameliella alba]|uniref:Glutaredoxin n=1 Tax=Mameliella alba TaxID=561184 RepID=A0A0B3SNL2_9RHOB|nr:glutaredoxin family protein [Mameliella alba]KHQ51994.1 Glutaredoxin [Mameliella alba]